MKRLPACESKGGGLLALCCHYSSFLPFSERNGSGEATEDSGSVLSPIPLRIFPEFSQFLSNFSPISRWAIRCPSVYKRWRRCRWAQLNWGLRRWWRPTHTERPIPLYGISSRVSVFSFYPPTMNSSKITKIQKKKKMPSKISKNFLFQKKKKKETQTMPWIRHAGAGTRQESTRES